MMERRRSQRIPVPEDRFGRVKATVPARIVDISRHGVQLEVPAALRPAVECDLTLPAGAGDVRIRARVQRCRAALEETGIVLGDYLPMHAYLATLDADQLAALDALPFVQWVGSYRDEWRLDPALVRQAAAQARDDGTTGVRIVVGLAPWSR